MKKKSYQQVLEMDENSTAISQFGWLPVSVYKPSKGLEWKSLIGDCGDHETRRSQDAEYLPGLRFSEFNPELAAMVIRYWSLEGNLIIDPFAGRAVNSGCSRQSARIRGGCFMPNKIKIYQKENYLTFKKIYRIFRP